MEVKEIPAQETRDQVMAGEAELAAFVEWFEAAFTGDRPAPPVPLELRRQDFAYLRFGRSCLETPLRIGSRSFDRGLGTHAVSEIAAEAPAGARRFEAWAGIDHNQDTQGLRGSAVFMVEVDGREVLRTPVLRGGEEPVAVSVDLPEGARQVVLKVDPTEDGPSHDQADWAEARFVFDDGTARYLDEGRRNEVLASDRAPFSFVYGGVSGADLLSAWPREVEKEETSDHRGYRVAWTDPDSGLRVVVEAKVYRAYPAADWVLHFENTGAADSPLVEDIQALDIDLLTGSRYKTVWLNQIRGDDCGLRSFLAYRTGIYNGQDLRMASTGGRSSQGAFPTFDFRYGDSGAVVSVGWSGQWAASFQRPQEGPTRLRAGMERTRLSLRPGERIRSPRILLMAYDGDRTDAINRFRRLMLFHYAPRIDGRPPRLPVASQCFDRYSWTRPEWATEAGQIEAVRFAHEAGFDTHWLDAAWFEGGFPNGVGNWYCKPQAFPNGLKPVSDACRALGMRFVVWFEPERVAPGSQIAREHPEYVHGGAEGGLFKLDDPEARRWITDLVSRRIEEYGVDIYRQDFNMDPLDHWRRNDAPDRQGITEIRYVEGLYAMWDDLLERHPGLLIDNCSSGGRRIDLETCSRAVPFWRSDTNCTPGHADWNQSHTAGLGQYVPLNMACAWTPEPYILRSAATAGLICQWDYMNPEFPTAQGRALLDEVKVNQKYWYGDFYPIVAAGPDPDQWGAYQFHRPDLDEGLILVFRRPETRYTGIEMSLRGLDAGRDYLFEFVDQDGNRSEKRMRGAEALEPWEVRLPGRGTSLVIRYRGV